LPKMYPLTHPQMRIWYVEKTFPGTSVANIAATVRIKERIDYIALEKALNHFIKINDSMRTRIIEQGTTPKQFFSPYEESSMELYDFSGQPVEALYEWDTKLSRISMPFIDSPLFYFVLFKLNDFDGGFFCKLHHLITDAWSEMLIVSQVMNAYRSFCEDREPEQTSNYSYIDYIAREQNYLLSDRYQKDQIYWIEQFTPVPELVTLQTKKPAKRSLAAKRKTFILSNEEAEQIRLFCKINEVTVFSFLLTMLTIYINRLTGSNDVVLGTPVLNRLNSKEKQMMGMFISTVPLRFRIDENAPYLEYVSSINKAWLSILRHQQFPYDVLQRTLRKSNTDLENLFEITLSYQNAKVTRESMLWDASTRWHFSGYQNEPLVIHINDHDDNGVLILNYDYNTSCFADREIQFIHSHFKSLLEDALHNPTKPIKSLSLIGQDELQRIQAFNSISSDYDKNKTFVELFERQVNLTPQAHALVFHDIPLTFADLELQANRLAYHLRSSGVKPDNIVAVMLPRGHELIISLLGVLKSGGAFLPIDPSYPSDRIKYMLSDSTAKFVITTPELANNFAINPGLVIPPNDKRINEAPSSRLPLVNKPEDLIYIIYTSGSTGLPKGVMVKHSGLSAYIHALNKIMYFQAGEAVLSICTIAFDIFIFEVFPSLVYGMKIILADENEQKIPSLQKELITNHKIVKFLGTPVRMKLLLDDPGSRESLANLKEVMLGGDIFPVSLLKQMQETLSAEIFNGYGPTETTIGVTFKNLTHSNDINIGRPIANTKIYILDKHMNLVPIGIPGEIYIGGDGLARGYLNNPELTSEKFIPNTFTPGEYLYRTGDLGRWYPKGEIAFLGRIDSQVKIHGHRIELGEIENAIRKHPNISDVVVLDIEDRGRKALCAYIVPSKDQTPDFHVLRKELYKRLPNFMVPSFYMLINTIPLNSSGKTDRRALPAPDSAKSLHNKFEPLTDSTEIKLSNIWEQILGLLEINAGEDFFELGGDSLDVVNLITAIHCGFGAELSISDIYELPTLRMQAEKIKELKTDGTVLTICPNLVTLHHSIEPRKVFFIHAGNGEINNYYELTQLLNSNMSFYGLRYLTNSVAPNNVTIQELANLYLQQIRTVQPQGPYNLIGWCIGGTIAFEIARQLEELGEQIDCLSLINSISPRVWHGVTPFTQETELKFLLDILPEQEKYISTNALDIQALWQDAIKELQSISNIEQLIRTKIPNEVAVSIPNLCNTDMPTLIKYINIIRTLHVARVYYKPSTALNTKLSFIEVSANDVITDKNANLADWQRFCSHPINRLQVPGDHYSIFAAPNVVKLAHLLSSLLGRE